MNVPKLRFKEFNDEWQNGKLEDVVDFLDDRRKPIKDSDRNNIKGVYPYYGASGIIDYINDYIFDESLLLLGEDGANIISRSTKLVFKATGKYWVNNHAHVLKPKENYNIDFLESYLENINYEPYNTGTAQPKLNQEVCRKINIKTPSLKEQVKIGKTLSLLDKKIELQTKKIKDLKLFKLCIKKKLFSKLNNSSLVQVEKLLDFEQPNKYIVDSEEYINDCNAIPVLTANKAFILGYCKEDNFYNKGNCIIFDDFTMDMKYVSFPFKIKSSAIKILTSKENIDLKYIYEYLSHLNLHSEEHKRHYISMVQKIYIPNPEYNVQKNISLKLTCIDSLLFLENSKLEKLIKLKKGLMQNMFV